MTISSVHRSDSYTGDGTARIYPFTYFIFLASHLEVSVTTPTGIAYTLALSTDGVTGDYTVSGTLNGTGGTVTLLNSGQAWLVNGRLVNGYTITIARVVPLTQLTNVRGEGPYNPEIHENEYDLIVMALQQIDQAVTVISQAVGLSDAIPQPLGTAAPGVGLLASRDDHVHQGQTISQATTTSFGIIQLAGDLSGTATAPTVPGLAGIATEAAIRAAADTAEAVARATADATEASTRAAADLLLVPKTTTLTGTAPIQIDGSNAAQDLSASRTISINTGTLGGFGTFGLADYGDGSDGDLTLAADATLTASQYVFRYSNVTLNGFILTAADDFTLFQVKGTLSLGGGTLRSKRGTAVAAPASTQTGGTGLGGSGGGTTGCLHVRARTITGTGSIHASGTTGTAGTNGGTTLENTAHGANGGTNARRVMGNLWNAAAPAGNPTGQNALTATQRIVFAIAPTWFYLSDIYIDASSRWYNIGDSACSGETAEAQAGNGPAGGAGGGGSGYYGAGGTGGTGEVRAVGVGGGGGAGGAGGSSGTICIVVTETAPSTLTVAANGGAGGAGGAKGTGAASGNGAGGGGGGGGLAILVAQTGCIATVTANGGALGAVGGSGATAATAGGAGLAMALFRS